MENFDSGTILQYFSAASLGAMFIKAFSIVFSLVFLIYTVVTFKQTQEITRTITNRRNRFILTISGLQILVGLVLLVFAILFV